MFELGRVHLVDKWTELGRVRSSSADSRAWHAVSSQLLASLLEAVMIFSKRFELVALIWYEHVLHGLVSVLDR